ncbi:MAG: Crp/Fnr family transcriptional regulator [SAR324 cluster bacterium]
MSCIGCKTCETAEWSGLESALLRLIDSAKATRRFQPGESIYDQGSPCTGLICIETGTVAIRQSDAEGNSRMLRAVAAGQTLGYPDYFAGKTYRTSADCLQPATLCHIPAYALQRALAASPALGLAFLSHCAEDLQDADLTGLQQAKSPVRVRLVHMLLQFKDLHGVSDDKGGIIVSMPITWREAAELVGAGAETVSRAMRALEQEEIIQIQGRIVFIQDLDLLLDASSQATRRIGGKARTVRTPPPSNLRGRA